MPLRFVERMGMHKLLLELGGSAKFWSTILRDRCYTIPRHAKIKGVCSNARANMLLRSNTINLTI